MTATQETQHNLTLNFLVA